MAEKILVTGAAGFIGFHVAMKFLKKGSCVIGVDNLNDYYDVKLKQCRLQQLEEYKDFLFFKGDIKNMDFLNSVFVKASPCYVIHLAAQAGVRYSINHPQVYIDSNIIGFFNILEACRHQKIKHLIFTSSSSVYGNQKKCHFP